MINTATRPMRVLYSFPHKIGADRICHTAWEQVNGLASAGAEVLVFPGVLHRPLPPSVRVKPTLAIGKARISYKLVGNLRACALHDYIVSKRLEDLKGEIDIVHAWPLGALRTLKTAARLGIPTVLERPNCHTRYAYRVVEEECRRLDLILPPGSEHAFDPEVLRREEEEYELATGLLCPSAFVVRSFVDQGFPESKLVRHIYGYDEKVFYTKNEQRDSERGLKVLFVGYCAVRKGVHHALEAWLQSPAHREGTFRIAGEFLPEYAEKLSGMLSDPSVKALGHRRDVAELMRSSDVLVLPSIEEGFGLVCVEAMASGCVPLVSEACTDVCKHMENALVHRVGDVDTLRDQITRLNEDRTLLARLRANCLRTAPQVTWKAAGEVLLEAYREVISAKAGLESPRLQTKGARG